MMNDVSPAQAEKLYQAVLNCDIEVITSELDGVTVIKGRTYPFRDLLKEFGAIWDSDTKEWLVDFSDATELGDYFLSLF